MLFFAKGMNAASVLKEGHVGLLLFYLSPIS
jgi:hypothetical protein